MKKIKLAKNLYQYQFQPFDNQHFGFNIYVMVDGRKALLIDTAFEQHATTVIEDLKKEGVEIKEVVFSHFHPDHISGLPVLDSPKIYGNALYQESLDRYTPLEKHHYFSDVNILTAESTVIFGEFQLKFRPIKGHVICGLFTIINNQFVHVADDVMASNDGVALLPSVHRSNVNDHIESLELLKDYAACTLLLSHGNAISGEHAVLQAIESRQRYLKAILNSEHPISIEEALEGCDCKFLHQEWHDYVYN